MVNEEEYGQFDKITPFPVDVQPRKDSGAEGTYLWSEHNEGELVGEKVEKIASIKCLVYL